MNRSTDDVEKTVKEGLAEMQRIQEEEEAMNDEGRDDNSNDYDHGDFSNDKKRTVGENMATSSNQLTISIFGLILSIFINNY